MKYFCNVFLSTEANSSYLGLSHLAHGQGHCRPTPECRTIDALKGAHSTNGGRQAISIEIYMYMYKANIYL